MSSKLDTNASSQKEGYASGTGLYYTRFKNIYTYSITSFVNNARDNQYTIE